MGRVDEAKGIYDLIPVVNNLRKQFPDFTLHIVGSGGLKTSKEEERFRMELKKRKVINHFVFHGYLRGIDKFNLLANAKVFVLPSKSESFCVSLLEAVACATPAVAYNLPVFRKLYKNNEVITVPISNVDAFSSAVYSILTSTSYINKQGYSLLSNHKFSYDYIAKREYDQFR